MDSLDACPQLMTFQFKSFSRREPWRLMLVDVKPAHLARAPPKRKFSLAEEIRVFRIVMLLATHPPRP